MRKHWLVSLCLIVLLAAGFVKWTKKAWTYSEVRIQVYYDDSGRVAFTALLEPTLPETPFEKVIRWLGL